MVTVLVRGLGDIGSTVGHRLFIAGYGVLLHASPQPTDTRRGMAFTDAVFDGQATLEEVSAVRVDDLAHLPVLLAKRAVIPVVVTDFAQLLRVVAPDVLIDARMRKRAHPERQRGIAPLTIGLGPNFMAGETTDLAVETKWGETLGTVLTQGATHPLEGEPRPIAGIARARYVYAPQDSIFRTVRRIGDLVCAGETVAHLGSLILPAPLDGALRGLTRDGVPVPAGTKVIEVDPRGPAAVVMGIGQRPNQIAEGVWRAVQTWVDTRGQEGSASVTSPLQVQQA